MSDEKAFCQYVVKFFSFFKPFTKLHVNLIEGKFLKIYQFLKIIIRILALLDEVSAYDLT